MTLTLDLVSRIIVSGVYSLGIPNLTLTSDLISRFFVYGAYLLYNK